MGEGRYRNELCWCGSGKKFKRCHLRREEQSPLSRQQVWEAFREAQWSGSCLHPCTDECTGEPVRSHTVDRGVSLQAIAENGHVLGYRVRPFNPKAPVEFGEVGIHQASTFPGFCGYHDNATFRPIENRVLIPTAEQAALVAFRALCLELHKKKAVIAITNEVFREADRGRSPAHQVAHQEYVTRYLGSSDLGLRDLETHKARFDAMVRSNDFAHVEFLAVFFREAPRVVWSGAVYPEHDFRGRLLQDLHDPAPAEGVFHASLATGDSGLFLLVWLAGASAPRALAQSLMSLPDPTIGPAILRFAFEYCENLYVSPVWWEALTEAEQHRLDERFLDAVDPRVERSAGVLVDDGLTLTPGEVVGWSSLPRDIAEGR